MSATFDYEVDKNHPYLCIVTEIEPSIETMRMLYDNMMRVSLILCASHERGRFKSYEINHKRKSDYEYEQIDVLDMQWRDEESYSDFIKRVTERLYRRIGSGYECRTVRYVSGSSISRYYRTGESLRSETSYVYEIDKEGNETRIE